MLEQFKAASPAIATLIFLVANVLIFLSSVALCWCLGRVFHRHRLFDRWEPLRGVEVLAAVGAVILNASVSMLGWWLWTLDVFTVQPFSFTRLLMDCLLMVLFMDFGMYWLHRIAHHPFLFATVHRFHHRHEVTNPISLFVLHPVEVLGFGCLMIAFLVVYPISLGGLMAYLTLNILFGTLGHSGVEPFPNSFKTTPVLSLLGTSTFHAEHHEHPSHNFGFYTLVWDKLFNTLDPDYDERFGRAS